MQMTYDGSHSLLIGTPNKDAFDRSDYIDTWKDWHLVPKELPIIAPPEVQKDYIQVPGTNGSLDLTEALLGYPLYNNRSGSLEFYVNTAEDGWDWDIAYDTILNAIHGFTRRLILTDCLSYYYEGRLEVNEFRSEKVLSTISIDYEFSPFKRMLFSTAFENWLWNPFDFVNGIIPNRENFVFEVAANSDSDWIRLPADVTGLMPVSPALRVVTEEKVDWTQMTGQPPAMMWKTNTDYPSSEVFKSSDPDTGTVSTSIITHRNPILLIGKPIPGYFFEYQFQNRFKNSNGDYIPATFYLDFRPGRL